jgi:hypothetical protein
VSSLLFRMFFSGRCARVASLTYFVWRLADDQADSFYVSHCGHYLPVSCGMHASNVMTFANVIRCSGCSSVIAERTPRHHAISSARMRLKVCHCADLMHQPKELAQQPGRQACFGSSSGCAPQRHPVQLYAASLEVNDFVGPCM